MGKRGPLPNWTPISNNLFESSLMDEPDLAARWLMVVCIKIAGEPGRKGTIDMPLTALATRARMSLEDTTRAVSILCQDDPNSRTQGHRGARLVLLPGRAWGWSLVNWETYRLHGPGRDNDRNSAKLGIEGRVRKEKGEGEGGEPPAPPAPPSPALQEVASLWEREKLHGNAERYFYYRRARGGWRGIESWEDDARAWAADQRATPKTPEEQAASDWGRGRPAEADQALDETREAEEPQG